MKFFYSRKFLFYADNSLRSLYVTFGAFHGITFGRFFERFIFLTHTIASRETLGIGGSDGKSSLQEDTQLPGFLSCFPVPSFFDR